MKHLSLLMDEQHATFRHTKHTCLCYQALYGKATYLSYQPMYGATVFWGQIKAAPVVLMSLLVHVYCFLIERNIYIYISSQNL